jgi:hypothetical protein
MYLQQLEVERYKAYKERSILRLCPLTILVGSNSSGKSAIARAAALLAGGLSAHDEDGGPLPLQSLGLVHGVTFHDLLWGHSTHGSLELAATFAGLPAGDPVRLEVVVKAVVLTPGGDPLQRVARWALSRGERRVSLELPDVTREDYGVRVDDAAPVVARATWWGLRPSGDDLTLPDWVAETLDELRTWARNVRYLVSPRRLIDSPFRIVRQGPLSLSPDGAQTPLVLASDDALREDVMGFFRKAFGVEPEIVGQGSVGSLAVRQHGALVSMAQAGQGLAQVLPVATMLCSSASLGAGLDVIEHPEAELHPGAHGDVADLLLSRMLGAERPVVVETHSEMILLRVRRWVAEGKVKAADVGINWVESDRDHGSSLHRIEITDDGQVREWPEGVFYEDYEEILAIRRAARERRP